MSVVKTHLGWALLSLLVLALAPALVKVPYFLHLGILALIWVIVAQGQNLVQGFTGYVSIAAAGFMGVGAYASTLLTTKLGWSVWTSMVCAPLIAGLLAIMVGYPSLRVKGHYFAIVTMAYNLVIFIVLINYSSLTGGESGITGVPKPENVSVFGLLVNFETRNAYYYLTLICAVCATVICGLVLHSRVGRVLLAIRQNEPLVDAAGVFAWRYKMFAFVLSASLCGVAGALYAHFIGFLNPEPFGVDQSLNAILAVILGGSGTLAGPVVGAFLVVALPEFLRVAETYRLIVYGLLLVLTTIFMPRGIIPLLAYAWHLFTSLFKRR
jgi:branched-chain amino acid transport system permease protein